MARKNRQQISVPRLVTSIALTIALLACSSQPEAPETIDITSAPTMSAQTYMTKADTLQGSAQNDWLIMALKASIEEKKTKNASFLINLLAKRKLSETQQAEWQLIRAKHLNMLKQPQKALARLNFPRWWIIPQEQWKHYHTLRADLLQQTGDFLNASRQLILLAQLSPEEEHKTISEQIWNNLFQYSEFKIRRLPVKENETELTGWLELALSVKMFNQNMNQMKNVLEVWMQKNPNHMASIYTPNSVQAVLGFKTSLPKMTALLLPISGKYEKQSKRVQDGFLMALMNDPARKHDATLTIIDTNETSSEEIIQLLDSQDVDFIVGPLRKEKIEEITKIQNARTKKIPMLALNLPDNIDIDTDMDTCYLTLSPEQEVEQAAKYLFSQGFQFPLILASKDLQGERIASTFQNEWEKHSSTQAIVSYFGNKEQLQYNIHSIFGINESRNRINQIKNLLDIDLKSQARSRRDIDSVYIVATNSELTLIKPFIEVTINPEVTPPKLFSSSSTNDNSKRQFEDLSGVTFSDIPMLIEENASLTSQMEALWPNQNNNQKRLQALGMDAYLLIDELPQMKAVPDYQVKGQTGLLSLDNRCIVQRAISWTEHESL